MIVVRNVFRLKFGQAKPAVAAFKEGRALIKKLGINAESRLLTDLVGTSYTIVHELQFEGLTAFEQEMKKVSGSAECARGTRPSSRTPNPDFERSSMWSSEAQPRMMACTAWRAVTGAA